MRLSRMKTETLEMFFLLLARYFYVCPDCFEHHLRFCIQIFIVNKSVIRFCKITFIFIKGHIFQRKKITHLDGIASHTLIYQ